jgi:acyl-CoA thioesterase
MDQRQAAGPAEDAQALAERVAQAMVARDRASLGLGIRVVRVAPGRAELTMDVRPDMLNGHGTCHGGFVFILADAAFSYASNSYNLATVASGCAIDFLAPAREGDRLTALAQQVKVGERIGVYDIDVTRSDGRRIALVRGRSHRTGSRVVDDSAG